MPRKVKSFKSDLVPESRMILRMVTVRADTANDDEKSIEVVVASENPVERYDEERGEVVREILSMDGLAFRNTKRKLPIVDSHDRSTTRNVFGSVRDLRVEGTELVGRAMFARDGDSQDAYWKLKDGHIDDFSITATPREVQAIQRGETALFREIEYEGPVDIVTDWMPTDASLVAVGADETSTQRSALLRSYQELNREVMKMTDETRAALVGRGMPEDASVEEALEFAVQHMAEEPEEEIENMDEPLEEVENQDEPAEEVQNEDKPDDEEAVKNAVDRALKADHKRQREIKAICQKAGMERAFADELCKPGVTLEIARDKVLERMVKNNKALGTTRIELTADSQDKYVSAARDGLIQRALDSVPRGGQKERVIKWTDGNPAPGHEDFRYMGLQRMAEEFLRRDRIDTTRFTPKDIAMVAMGHRPTINRMQHSGLMRSGEAYHTTGRFTNLLLDAQNKTLLAGYDEAEFTWNLWARQAPSVADFKNIHRMRFSEAPDPSIVPEGKDYPEGKTSDSKESYVVDKYGEVFTVTWETIVNDDMDALSRIPQMHGAACRRKQNKVVYAVLTDNANMSDGHELFDASNHSNLAGSGAVISTTTLNAAYASMRTQTNLGGEIISVVPQFLIVPAAIEATAFTQINSIADPSVGGDTTGSSGVTNIYGPGGPRRLTVVGEPQLDGNSITSWYLAAGNTQVDTVELSFLQGEESPVLESEWDFDKDVFKNKVRQTFGAKAIDWRGLYKNPGA